jgi:hypothetical protein
MCDDENGSSKRPDGDDHVHDGHDGIPQEAVVDMSDGLLRRLNELRARIDRVGFACAPESERARHAKRIMLQAHGFTEEQATGILAVVEHLQDTPETAGSSKEHGVPDAASRKGAFAEALPFLIDALPLVTEGIQMLTRTLFPPPPPPPPRPWWQQRLRRLVDLRG